MPLLTTKKLSKIGEKRGKSGKREEKSGENQEKEEEEGEEEEKKKGGGQNRKGSFTLPLLTNRAGYATGGLQMTIDLALV